MEAESGRQEEQAEAREVASASAVREEEQENKESLPSAEPLKADGVYGDGGFLAADDEEEDVQQVSLETPHSKSRDRCSRQNGDSQGAAPSRRDPSNQAPASHVASEQPGSNEPPGSLDQSRDGDAGSSHANESRLPAGRETSPPIKEVFDY